MQEFSDFFRTATGYSPYGYQERLARDGLPAVVQAPTGAGKTGVILAWLWRRVGGPTLASTPRRLIYALPQRSLVEQVASEAERWLANLRLADQVALHVVMGGAGKTQWQWRLDMHQPAIVVGTVDSLVSKALLRGYGIGRAAYPVDFALVTNGAHWIIDEIQLCPEATTTLRQLAAFAESLGTAEPFALTCMSATVPERLLGTVDNPAPGHFDMLKIEPRERIGELAVRLDARRTVRRLQAEPGSYAAIASLIRERHRPGTLTLAVLNTVDAARNVFALLNKDSAPRTLLHSRFRGVERARLMREVTSELGEAGRIVVATQVVEAGIDISARILLTEAAPWPSLVQRAGRCNRDGRAEDAELWWVRPAKPEPYPQADIDAADAGLSRLEGRAVTGEDLLGQPVAVIDTPVTVLRKSDFIALFDTAPDLSGADLDVSPYVRDADDLDVQVAWATWASDVDGGNSPGDGGPPPEAKAPPAEWRCRVPLWELRKYLKREGVAAWRFDQVLSRWTRVTPGAPAQPGETLLVSPAHGGYDLRTGFDPKASGLVPYCPDLRTGENPATGAEDAYRGDMASVEQRAWISLDQHSVETRDQADALLSALQPGLSDDAMKTAVRAAYLHDIGKAHEIWQDALCGLAADDERAAIEAGRPWAKSGVAGRLRFRGEGQFRHELASLLLLDGPLRGLLADVPDPDLARYLVLAHHGKLRLQVRDPGDLAVLARANGADRGRALTAQDGNGERRHSARDLSGEKPALLGLKQDSTVRIPRVLDEPETELTVNLDQFSLGGERSWSRTALGLRDRYRPFVLAYLEAVVRIADWRASRGMELPSPAAEAAQ